MAPRPILKSLRRASGGPNLLNTALPFSSSSSILFSPHVHFPPTPALTATFAAYSSEAYDRKPILVSQNDCNLPDRDERVYLDFASTPHRIHPSTERRPRSNAIKPIGSYFHPRAFEACERDKIVLDDDVFLSDGSDSDMTPPGSPPELTFSSSSASELSDSEWSPRMPSPLIPLALRIPQPKQQSNLQQPLPRSALSFLPHPGGIHGADTPDTLLRDSARVTQIRKRKSGKFYSQRKGGSGATASHDRIPNPSLDDGCLGGF